MLLDIAAKRSANKWNVPDDGNLVLDLLHVFTHQAGERRR